MGGARVAVLRPGSGYPLPAAGNPSAGADRPRQQPPGEPPRRPGAGPLADPDQDRVLAETDQVAASTPVPTIGAIAPRQPAKRGWWASSFASRARTGLALPPSVDSKGEFSVKQAEPMGEIPKLAPAEVRPSCTAPRSRPPRAGCCAEPRTRSPRSHRRVEPAGGRTGPPARRAAPRFVGEPFLPAGWGYSSTMRAMAFVWAVILVGGIGFFTIIGLTHS